MARMTRAELRAYAADIDAIGDEAARQVEALIGAYVEANPDATVAEVREFAIEAVNDVAQVTCEAASARACDMYDQRMAGTPVAPARIVDTDAADYVGKEAHYQARHLVDGDTAAFARAMGRFGRDQVHRNANRTVTWNAGRSGRSVRYARVPIGIETCEFCNMLASRGFVYWSEEKAGKFDRYHSDCRCAVIPGYEGDTVLDGYHPEQERALGEAMREIDANPDLTYAQKQQAKEALTEYNALEYYAQYEDLGGKQRWYAPIEDAGENQYASWQRGDTRSSQQTRGQRARREVRGEFFGSQQDVWAFTARAAAQNPDQRDYWLAYVRRTCREAGHPEWADGIEDLWDATAEQRMDL